MLSDDVLAFLRSRPISILSTRDAACRPSQHESLLPVITPTRIQVLVPAHLARNLEANVADNGDGSLLVSRQPGDHRSVQMKGKLTHLEVARPRPEALAILLSPLTTIYGAFVSASKARRLAEQMLAMPTYAVWLEVRAVFDQTPGPGAGRQIGGETP